MYLEKCLDYTEDNLGISSILGKDYSVIVPTLNEEIKIFRFVSLLPK